MRPSAARSPSPHWRSRDVMSPSASGLGMWVASAMDEPLAERVAFGQRPPLALAELAHGLRHAVVLVARVVPPVVAADEPARLHARRDERELLPGVLVLVGRVEVDPVERARREALEALQVVRDV